MNLLKRFKLSRELARMEKRAKENPSPSVFVDLAQAYINLGWIDHTLRVSQEGLLLFPRSEELLKVYRYARVNRLNRRVRELKERVAKHPTPDAYHELAGVFRDIGDKKSLFSVCAECTRRFPEDTESLLILGQARIGAHGEKFREEDGKEAVRALNGILELEPEHEEGHRLLGTLYFRIGAVKQARPHFQKLADGGRLNDEDRRIMEKLQSLPENPEEPEELLQAAEKRGAYAHFLEGAGAGSGGVAPEEVLGGIREGLSRLVQIQGVSKAAYIRGSKALVKGAIRSGKDPFLKTIRVISKASQRAVRRMDLGNFSKGVVDGTFGHILICTFGDVTAAIQCKHGTKVDRLLNELQELVAGSLFVAGKREI